MWKVNFARVYDYLDYDFLWSFVRRRGFPKAWILWVRRCITTDAFSILVNCGLEGMDSIVEGSEARMPTGTFTNCKILAVDVLATCAHNDC